ncbi:MAG TPA: hypothetical protein VFO38_06610 [Candidatus Saccharimonadales bacterium]|nr:hypothetical protein [Candidatus Saccharimonadales bacterium]
METIGCLCFPRAIMPELESVFIADRIKHRVWAEVKWSRLCTPYCDKYKSMVSNYLASSQVTYHSWTYSIPSAEERKQYYNGSDSSKIIYRHAYLLIRTVIWKCRNSGYRGPFYILADETGKLGREEYKITQELLKNDAKIDPPASIDFCNTGNSTSCGAMQVVDLLTGAVMSQYDEKFSKQDACIDFVEHLTALNNGVPLTFSSPGFPRLGAQKMQHCLFKPRGL